MSLLDLNCKLLIQIQNQFLTNSWMGNKTIAPMDQASSQNVHAAQAESLPDNNPQQAAQIEVKSAGMSLKAKLIIAALVVMVLAGVGVGIYFIVDHFAPKMAVQKTASFSFPDNSRMKVAQLSFTDINVVQDNQKFTVYAIGTGNLRNGRRLQESDIDLFVRDHGAGLTMRIKGIKAKTTVQVLLSPGEFLNAVGQETEIRMLQTDISGPSEAALKAEYAQIEANLFAALSEIFTGAVNEDNDNILKFSEKAYQKYSLVDSQFKLQPAPAHARRMLARIRRGGRRYAKAAVTPAINKINENSLEFNQVLQGAAETQVVSITGEPASFSGAVGSIAQKVLNNCVPEDTATFVCSSTVGAPESYSLLVGQLVHLETDINKIKSAIDSK